MGVQRVTDLEQFPVRISKDEVSFDCCLSGRCERKTTTLWSAALRIPRPHIRVAFSLWTDWWWKRASFAVRLSVCLWRQTYVTDLARFSRLKQADEIRPDLHVFFLRKHTYFDGSDNLLDSKVMLCTRLSSLGRFSTLLCKQKLPFWAL